MSEKIDFESVEEANIVNKIAKQSTLNIHFIDDLAADDNICNCITDFIGVKYDLENFELNHSL